MAPKKYRIPKGYEHIDLARPRDFRRGKDIVSQLMLQTENLTRNDLKKWRQAWQLALNVDYPQRNRLLNIYTDVDVDLHLTGCVSQRSGFILNKGFKIINAQGDENPELTEIFEAPWFKEWMRLSLESIYYGHSLIELGDIIEVDGKPAFSSIRLIPRTHVIPEYGVIVKNENETWQNGFDYRNSELADWCTEAGGPRDLGLYLKCAQQTIPKKNMCTFWDMFGEIFGMPLRIATTTSRDPREQGKVEKMLQGMGAAAWALFPEGTNIEIKESTRGDAFNVYDKRIDRCNSELSKGVLSVTMTMDSGASLSQSRVHQDMLDNLIGKDADFVKDLVNWQLIPKMIKHGFPLKGFRFQWDEGINYSPEQKLAYEQFLAQTYDVDPQYFIEQYNMPLKEKEHQAPKPTKPGDPKKKTEKLFFD